NPRQRLDFLFERLGTIGTSETVNPERLFRLLMFVFMFHGSSVPRYAQQQFGLTESHDRRPENKRPSCLPSDIWPVPYFAAAANDEKRWRRWNRSRWRHRRRTSLFPH